MCCLQAFFFLVLGGQLNFNGKINPALQGQQERINQRLGSLIFLWKTSAVLNVVVWGGSVIPFQGNLLCCYHLGQKNSAGNISGSTEVTAWEQEHPQGSHPCPKWFLSHLGLGELRAALPALLVPRFSSSLQSGKPRGCWWALSGEVLDQHWNGFGFTKLTPWTAWSAGELICCSTIPHHFHFSPLKFALLNKFLTDSVWGSVPWAAFGNVNPCWVRASCPQTFPWIFPTWFWGESPSKGAVLCLLHQSGFLTTVNFHLPSPILQKEVDCEPGEIYSSTLKYPSFYIHGAAIDALLKYLKNYKKKKKNNFTIYPDISSPFVGHGQTQSHISQNLFTFQIHVFALYVLFHGSALPRIF